MSTDTRTDIDLFNVVADLWSARWVIVSTAIVSGLLGVVYALLATPIFRAQVVLAPTDRQQSVSLSGGLAGLASLAGFSLPSSSENIHAVPTLRSRAFIEDFVRDENLLPILFSERWDAAGGRWKSDNTSDWPDLQDGVKFFIDRVRTVDEEPATGLITLAIEWSDRELVAEWAGDLVERVNEQLRARDLADARRRLDYLNAQLQQVSLVELREAISRLIEEQIERVMLAEGETEYAFRVIDPPRVPNRRISPKRTLIVLTASILGGGLAMMFVLVRQRIRTLRAARTRPPA